MPTIDEQLQKKKAFKKKSYRSYLSLDETLETLAPNSKEEPCENLPSNSVQKFDPPISTPSITSLNALRNKKSEDCASHSEIQNKLPTGEESGSNRVVISQESGSNQIVIGEELGSNRVVIGEESDSNRVVTISNNHGSNGWVVTGEESDSSWIVNGKELGSNRIATGEVVKNDRVVTSRESDSSWVVNRVGTGEESGSRPNVPFQRLSPLEQQIVEFIYQETKKHRSKVSPCITGNKLREITGTTAGTIKYALRGLKTNKAVLKINDSKAGPGGWYIFQLVDEIYAELISLERDGHLPRSMHKQANNRVVTGEESGSNRIVNRIETPPSSSSDLNITKTTTEKTSESDKTPLPEDWQEIDYSCLVPYRFTENHLLQIYQCGKVTPELTQESIYELHHDLTVNKNTSLRNPRNVLLSLLKRGSPYTSPGYEPEYLKAERRCLEEQKRRQGELTQIQEEQERLNHLPAKLKQDVLFQTWLTGTTEKQRREIAPHAKTDGSEMQRGILRSYWENTTAAHNDGGQAITGDEVRRIAEAQFGKFEKREFSGE